jgi:soluble lytic murein transglycosylase-like protein
MVAAESGFQIYAVSQRGAEGLMQLMPATARELGVQNSFDPEQNILGGLEYMKRLLERYRGDENLALAAYNAGMSTVDRLGRIPDFDETQSYVQRVLTLRAQMTP